MSDELQDARDALSAAGDALGVAIIAVEEARKLFGEVELERFPAKSIRRDLTHADDELHRAKRALRTANADVWAFLEGVMKTV